MPENTPAIEVEFLSGSVSMTADEARQIRAVMTCAPYDLMVEKFLADFEREVIDDLRTGTFLDPGKPEPVADQARVNLIYELSQVPQRLAEAIARLDKASTTESPAA